MSMHKGLLGQSHGGSSVSGHKEDTTLGDYIARKQRQAAFEDVAQEKKFTFDEWYEENRTSATNQIIISGMTFEEWLFFAWKAAQENK